jgi:hypothetical protein
MRKPHIANIRIAILSLTFIACLPLGVFAAEPPGEKAVNKELEKDVGMPILDGDLWVKMAPDSKVAFVWGVWHVASIEHYLMGKYPDLKRDNFSAKVIEGSGKAPMTMNEVVALIDKYYQAHPDQIEKPVIAVIWSQIVKPNIATGIDGRPIKP